MQKPANQFPSPAPSWRARRAVAVALTLLLAGLANAATVRLEAGAKEAPLGEAILLELTVSDYRAKVGDPVPPQSDRFAIAALGGRSARESYEFSGGRQRSTRTVSYRFEVTPREPGILIIPGFAIEVDGETLESNPVRIHVVKADASPLMFAQVVADREPLYVGQKVVFTLEIWVKPIVVDRRELTPNEMYTQIEDGRRGFGPFPPARTYAERQRDSEDGAATRYYVFESELSTVLDRPGPPDFSEISVGMSYPTRFERGLFGDLQVAQARRLRAQPAVRVPDVRALPAEGRPSAFSGAVGSISLRARATPTNLRVGDPVTLTIELVSSDAPLESLAPPDLSRQPELTDAFRVPTESLAGVVEGAVKRFTQTVRPRSPDVSQIPPIEYAYFDPVAGQYRVARTDAIPITVAPSERLDAAGLSEIGPESASADPTIETRDTLRGLVTSESLLLANVRPVSQRDLAIVTFAPPGAFLIAWSASLVARRGRDTRRTRRARSLPHALRRVSAAESLAGMDRASEVASAIAEFLGDRTGEPPARFHGRGALSRLRELGASDETLRSLADLIDRCEAAAYGGGDAMDDLCDRARRCLRDLERVTP